MGESKPAPVYNLRALKMTSPVSQGDSVSPVKKYNTFMHISTVKESTPEKHGPYKNHQVWDQNIKTCFFMKNISPFQSHRKGSLAKQTVAGLSHMQRSLNMKNITQQCHNVCHEALIHNKSLSCRGN